VIRHRLYLGDTHRRVVRVELEVDLPAGVAEQDVSFPVWTPGSYLVREHERHIHDWAAFADGRPASSQKVAKNVYRVATQGARQLRVQYEVYAHELTVRTSHVDSSHAFLNPIGLCAYLPGREREPQQLVLQGLPSGWDAACALPDTRAGGEVIFHATDYDELVDSPIECGPHAEPDQRLAFDVRGVRHEIVLWGRSPLSRPRLAADVARIVEAQAALFGGLPYQRYLFIALASDTGRGGLEHRASSALLFPRASVGRPKGYEDFLGLIAHELFHAWNVKRIKPAAFTPYDLSRENHTTLLWAFEGLTSYYEDLFLVRAGLMTRARYLEVLAERMTQLERTPGRQRHSVAEASYDAWIRYYRQDENSDNSSVSYYLKGALIGTLVDLEIRRRTGGAASLDDAIRLLWREFRALGRGVPEDGIEAACSRVAGADLRPLFNLAVRGTEELPLEQALRTHGLKLTRRVSFSADDRGGPAPSGPATIKCDAGLALRVEGERARVAAVRRGSPAEDAGLCPGDELVAIDGLRADGASALTRIQERTPGEAVELTLFRRDELMRVKLTVRPPLADTFAITEEADAPADAKAFLDRWLTAG
jgi:predicted metalloprotease with PDZ domain